MKYSAGIITVLLIFVFTSCNKPLSESKPDNKVSESKTTEKIAPDVYWKAVGDNDVAKVKEYLGKDPSLVSLKTTDHIGETALAKVSFSCKLEMVKLLLENKSDPNEFDNYGVTALHGAARTDKADCLEAMLKNKGDVNIKEKNGGSTPLHYAADYNSVEAAKLLLRTGADKKAANKAGKTPYDVAVEKKSKDVIDLLK